MLPPLYKGRAELAPHLMRGRGLMQNYLTNRFAMYDCSLNHPFNSPPYKGGERRETLPFIRGG